MTCRRKILHLITTLESAGAQTLLLDTAERMDPARYEVTVAYLCGVPSALAGRADTGLRFINLGCRGRIDLAAPARIAALLARERFDLLHTHLVHAGVLGKLAARVVGLSRVVTTRHYAAALKSGSLFYRWEDLLTRSASRVIAVSEAVRRHLVERRIALPERIRTVPNGIDLARFDPRRVDTCRPARERGPTAPVIGIAGRLHPQKGHDTLLQAFARLRASWPAARLEIAGDGPLREALPALARRLGLGDAVRFLGSVSPARMPELLAGWDVFAFPSRWEAFGLALLEAMAMERPSVAASVEGIVELVEPGVTGLLVPPDEPAALTEAVQALLLDPAGAAALGARARAVAARRFSADATAQAVEAVYAELFA